MENKCSDPNIKGTLYVESKLKPTINISFEEVSTDVQRLQQCIKNIEYEINSNWGEHCQTAIDAILKEIKNVKDIL